MKPCDYMLCSACGDPCFFNGDEMDINMAREDAIDEGRLLCLCRDCNEKFRIIIDERH